MLELAKFAKQHIPEEHELDDPDFVDKRSASGSGMFIPDPNFSIPDFESRVKKIPDPGSKNLSIFTFKNCF
jgi:hypothetical protein